MKDYKLFLFFLPLLMQNSSCKSSFNDSSAKVVTDGDYLPSKDAPEHSCAIFYFSKDKNKEYKKLENLCTGDFIAKRKFLTSAICEEGMSNKSFARFIHCEKIKQTIRIFPKDEKVDMHPDFKGDDFEVNGSSINTNDVAIIWTPSDFKGELVELKFDSTSKILKSSECQVWGYGLNNQDTFGKILGISLKIPPKAIIDEAPTVTWNSNTIPISGDAGAGILCYHEKKRVRVGTVTEFGEIASRLISRFEKLSNNSKWVSSIIKRKQYVDKKHPLKYKKYRHNKTKFL